MIYTIVGVPGSGKGTAARRLGAKVDIDTITGRKFTEEMGFLSDYRSELFLASSRALVTEEPRIEVQSLIDNVAYSSLRVTDILSESPNDPNFEAWSITFDACLKMLVDGYTDRLTLYIPYEGDDDDHKDLDHALRATLDTLKIKYQEIDPEGEVDTWISN